MKRLEKKQDRKSDTQNQQPDNEEHHCQCWQHEFCRIVATDNKPPVNIFELSWTRLRETKEDKNPIVAIETNINETLASVAFIIVFVVEIPTSNNISLLEAVSCTIKIKKV